MFAMASADDEYFQNSVFRVLKDKGRQFRSQSKFERFFDDFTIQIEQNETYGFNTSNGLLVERYVGYLISYSHLFLGGKEIHSFAVNKPDCYSRSSIPVRGLPHFRNRWAPEVVFDPDHEFKMLGK